MTNTMLPMSESECVASHQDKQVVSRYVIRTCCICASPDGEACYNDHDKLHTAINSYVYT
jgi:hypothetical protein